MWQPQKAAKTVKQPRLRLILARFWNWGWEWRPIWLNLARTIRNRPRGLWLGAL